ncbi:MAG TPA: tyrosine--tRNA ligase [Candidatus Dormibacteraeota bacterium]|nr:tyrosine--tRNA ligase [Candidatus Dormibacteraeota bacterium]
MTLSEELTWRGFAHQTTLDDLRRLDGKPLTFYHGYDASSDSLTVGNLAALMMDRCFLRHGHRAVLLAGGATSLIGDPGGKDSERPLQTARTVEANVRAVERQIQSILGGNIKLVNNLKWFGKMNVLEFLRDVGKHFSMTPLVQRDYIAKRMGEGGAGISFTEFSYTLLQGYDFLRLFEHYGVTLQLAGSDQWGNGLSGVDLVRRVKGAEVNVLTCPLIVNKATGIKFGKSEEGSVWLDPDKTSPTQFYQFWINCDDAGVDSYLKIFTELDKPTIEDIMAKHGANPGARYAQTRLAQAVTEFVHGKKDMLFAETVTEYLTGAAKITGRDKAAIAEIKKAIPSVTSKPDGSVVEALAGSGLAASKTEARRLLDSRAVSVNNERIERENFEPGDFDHGLLLIRKGKKFKDSALVELG